MYCIGQCIMLETIETPLVPTSVLMVIFQVNLGQPVKFSSSTCSGKEALEKRGRGFLWARCPSCHPTNSVKALKETQSTDHNQ